MNEKAISAIRSKQVAVLQRLLASGFDPNEPDDAGRPWPLALAVLFSAKISKLLLDAGARTDVIDQFGRTMLFDTPFPEVVELLLGRGVDPHAKSKQPPGVTALMCAAEQGRVKVVTLLLDAGADPNVATPSGGNALAFACDQGRKEVVELLLERGAVPAGVGKNSPAKLAAAHRAIATDRALMARLAVSQNRRKPVKPTATKATSKSKVAFLPTGLDRWLAARKPQRRKKVSGKGPLSCAEIERRHGCALPTSLRQLLTLADKYPHTAIEGANFRFVRVGEGGWEMPVPIEGEAYARTIAQRFDWNTFSNMQLWEHFAGLQPLGWDRDDNRFAVSTIDEAAPVFWLDHETAELEGAVAPSLESFVRVQCGELAGVDERSRALVLEPSRWSREDDGHAYHARTGPLTSWPPFLAERAEWLVACAAFGSTEGKTESPAVLCFDLERELPLVGRHEPLALYWLLRSYYLEERDVFDEVFGAARAVSPFTASLAQLCEAQWNAGPRASPLSKMRQALKGEAKRLRRARWKTYSRDELV